MDLKSTGKLNAEQFAVAMHLISEKVNINRLHACSARGITYCVPKCVAGTCTVFHFCGNVIVNGSFLSLVSSEFLLSALLL